MVLQRAAHSAAVMFSLYFHTQVPLGLKAGEY